MTILKSEKRRISKSVQFWDHFPIGHGPTSYSNPGWSYLYTLQKSRNLPICFPSSNLQPFQFWSDRKPNNQNPPSRSKSQISHHFNKWHALDLSKFQWSRESHPSPEALPVSLSQGVALGSLAGCFCSSSLSCQSILCIPSALPSINKQEWAEGPAHHGTC